MNARATSDNLIIREFTAPKQIKLFSSLRESQVSGQLTFTDPIKGDEWHLYLYRGEIVYGSGGIHPIRRWQRNLILNLPQIPFQLSSLQEELTARKADLNNNTWEYEQISQWVEQQIITPQQGRNVIAFAVGEILFDITQARQVICRLNQDHVLPRKLELLKPEDLINQTSDIWKTWEEAQVADRLPNMAPVILQPQQLQQKTSISAYQSLCKLLNGNRTLRDLSVQLRTTPLQVVRSLLPYIQSGIFGLVDVPDLLELIDPANAHYESLDRPLIACIDDSLMISHMMEQIITMAGYRFLAINEPIDAVGILMNRQPDLIFLDVVMPKISGYDLCAQLRKYPEFAETPIIFLTSNSGIVDRIRAKIVGSTDFMRKTVDADELLQKISEYLS
ncbi:MAG: response regulator [Cyanobacteria bacterium P01_G01_bin.67]